MKEINVSELKDNMFDAISKEWMLVTAGTQEKFNMMTASWGGTGVLWAKPVAFIFIRPERYTYQFIEEGETLTLSFLGEEHKDIHKICGSKSGRRHRQGSGYRTEAFCHSRRKHCLRAGTYGTGMQKTVCRYDKARAVYRCLTGKPLVR